MSQLSFRHPVQALLLAGTAWAALGSVPAQAQTIAPNATGPAKPAALSRAEVTADLRLWRRLGLDVYAEQAGYAVNVQAYERAVAEYQQLRSGKAFSDELAKVLAGQ